LNKQFGKRKSKEKFAAVKTTSRILSIITQQKYWENTGSTVTVCHCVHCAKGGKRGTDNVYIICFFLTAGVKSNMLLIMFLGLIAKLALVSDGCDVGDWGVDSFNWTAVGIGLT
jgi:hypothetical protein